MNEKDQVKTDKDEGNFEAFYNKENTTMTQINTLDESVWETFVEKFPIDFFIIVFGDFRPEISRSWDKN